MKKGLLAAVYYHLSKSLEAVILTFSPWKFLKLYEGGPEAEVIFPLSKNRWCMRRTSRGVGADGGGPWKQD